MNRWKTWTCQLKVFWYKIYKKIHVTISNCEWIKMCSFVYFPLLIEGLHKQKVCFLFRKLKSSRRKFFCSVTRVLFMSVSICHKQRSEMSFQIARNVFYFIMLVPNKLLNATSKYITIHVYLIAWLHVYIITYEMREVNILFNINYTYSTLSTDLKLPLILISQLIWKTILNK